MPTFWALRQQLVVNLLSLALLVTFTPPGAGDVFTSSQKIKDLAASENSMLDTLSKYIVSEYDQLKALSGFLLDRSQDLQEKWKGGPRHLAHHPNGAFLLIQLFSQQWSPLVKARPGLQTMLGSAASILPTDEDYKGAVASLIRLQFVYKLSADDMYAGNYLGYAGPALQPADAFVLGRQAFIDGYLQESIQWLEVSTRLLQEQGGFHPATSGVSGNQASPFVSLAHSASLLGRCYLYMNDTNKAREMYDMANKVDPNAGDVAHLRKELSGTPVNYIRTVKPWDHNMTALCLRPKHKPVAKILTIHVCRYKQVLGHTYMRYKEEILSVTPYASVFYDVIRDDEIVLIKQYIKGKMFRGMVGQGSDARTANSRTSDLGWISDKDLRTADRLSQRIKLVTGLEVDQRLPDGPSSGEAMQVVNYGLGGHYSAHTDPSHHPPIGDKLFDRSGMRVATFLMYLSEVEMGGHTVFLKAGISVAPVKGAALFWYNLTPDMDDIDMLTQHAGCPVMIGEKWVANKWIRVYGNTFIRPCGLHANSTHQQVEQMLRTRLH